MDRGLNRLLGTLPRDHLALILSTVILSLSEEQQQAYYGTNAPVEGAVQTGQENGNPPTYARTDPHSPHPARASSPTDSLSSTNTAVNPLPCVELAKGQRNTWAGYILVQLVPA